MNKEPNIAVIGAGHWGKNHVRVFQNLQQLRWVCDANSELRHYVAEEYPAVRVTGDYQEMLQDKFVQGIVIATPAPTHHRIACDCLRAGKDVLVEKPMTLSMTEAEELVRLAEEKSRILMVGHLLLYKTATRKIIEILHSGLLGDIYHINMRRRKLGKVRSQENVLWSFAPHDVAVLCALANQAVTSVRSWHKAFLQPKISDDVRVDIAFKDGLTATLHVSWLWPVDERGLVIIGSKGMLTYDEQEDKIRLHAKSIGQDLNNRDEGKREVPFEKADALVNEAQHFLDCIAHRSVPVTDGQQGLQVVKILVEADQ